jgi:hypothetical protein
LPTLQPAINGSFWHFSDQSQCNGMSAAGGS